MACDAIEDRVTQGRIESLRVCYPTLEARPQYGLNPVTPWGLPARLRFRLGGSGGGVSFPFPLAPPRGKADTGVYFTTLAVREGAATEGIDRLQRELRCLLGGRLSKDWWVAPVEKHHRHLLRIMIDTETTMEQRAFVGGEVTAEDASIVTKGSHAWVDVELMGVGRFDSEEDGLPVWRPRLRAARVCVLEGVGVYVRAGLPSHNSQIREPSNVSALNYRGVPPVP